MFFMGPRSRSGCPFNVSGLPASYSSEMERDRQVDFLEYPERDTFFSVLPNHKAFVASRKRGSPLRLKTLKSIDLVTGEIAPVMLPYSTKNVEPSEEDIVGMTSDGDILWFVSNIGGIFKLQGEQLELVVEREKFPEFLGPISIDEEGMPFFLIFHPQKTVKNQGAPSCATGYGNWRRRSLSSRKWLSAQRI